MLISRLHSPTCTSVTPARSHPSSLWSLTGSTNQTWTVERRRLVLQSAVKLQTSSLFILLPCCLLAGLRFTGRSGGERGNQTALAAAGTGDPHTQLPEPHPGESVAHQQGAPDSQSFPTAYMWRLSSRRVFRTCCSGRGRSTQTAACCSGRSARCGRCWLAATSSWRKTSAGGKRRGPARGQTVQRPCQVTDRLTTLTRAAVMNLSLSLSPFLSSTHKAIQTRPLADVLRTAAGGTSRVKKPSRAVQLRGVCRPLLDTQANAASGTIMNLEGNQNLVLLSDVNLLLEFFSCCIFFNILI